MRMSLSIRLILGIIITLGSIELKGQTESTPQKLNVIFDTDANNELDDQHALAYLFSNQDYFDIKAITVNATRNGGDIQGHYDEAARIMQLFNINKDIPLLKGANNSYLDIKGDLGNPTFDGYKAVDFIISEAQKSTDQKLVVIAVGKLTNLALALEKEPAIANKIRLVWLGSNYPDPGEYNLEDDIPSMNFVLATEIEFEMVTVRYGKPSGTDAVKVTQEEVNTKMPGLGPKIATPIIGRHGGSFNNFGDYAVNLFSQIELHGNPPARSLFDMAAVAIVKNPEWAKSSVIPCPIMVDQKWEEQPNNDRKIVIWEHFDKEAIMTDFYNSLKLVHTEPLWQGRGRIAISSDGNEHDNDDWSATALSLAILGAKGIQDNVVLYTYSDHVWGSNLEWPKKEGVLSAYEQMKKSTLEGKEYFGFNKTNFICAVDDPEKAYNEMAKAINESSEDNPLFIVAAGPMQVVGEGINRAKVDKRKYVTLITHSSWNNEHADRPYVSGEQTYVESKHTGWTFDEIRTTFEPKDKGGINLVYISDQNGGEDYEGLRAPIENFDWIKTSKARNDKHYKKGSWDWLYSRLETCIKDNNLDWYGDPNWNKVKSKSFDASDAGMIVFLLTGVEKTNPELVKEIMEDPK